MIVLSRYGQKHALGHWMTSFIDGYLVRLQRGEMPSKGGCIRDEQPTDRQRTRNDLQGLDESNTAAAAQAYFTTPSTNNPVLKSAAVHFQAGSIGPRFGQMSSSSSSATSGFTPPSLNTITPPGGVNIHLEHQGSTPDMLDFSSHLDYGGAQQGLFYQMPEMSTQGIPMSGTGYVHDGSGMDTGSFGSIYKTGQQDMRSTDMLEGQPTLEEIFSEGANLGYADDASKIVWGGT